MIFKDDMINSEYYEIEKYRKLLKKSGVYCICGLNEQPLYVGRSKNIGNRIFTHIRNGPEWFVSIICGIRIYELEDLNVIDMYETHLINLLKPKYNKNKVRDYEPSFEIINKKFAKKTIEILINKTNENISIKALYGYINEAINRMPDKRVHRTMLTKALTRSGYFAYPSIGEPEARRMMNDEKIKYEKGYFVRITN